jgi:hypothetical protein
MLRRCPSVPILVSLARSGSAHGISYRGCCRIPYVAVTRFRIWHVVAPMLQSSLPLAQSKLQVQQAPDGSERVRVQIICAEPVHVDHHRAISR